MSISAKILPQGGRRRWLRVAGIIVFILALISWGGCKWVTTRAGSALQQRLGERGLHLEYASEWWTPWNGLTLTSAALRRNNADHDSIIELTGLHVDLLWQASWKTRTVITRLRTDDSTLVLHDESGPVTLNHFTVDLVASGGAIEVSRVETSDGALSLALSGKILLSASAGPTNDAISLDLNPIRATLAALKFKPGSGIFAVKGTFSVDSSASPPTWQADLAGAAKVTEWRGLPLQELTVQSHLSNTGLKLDTVLRFAKGSVKVLASREGWDSMPLMLSGTLIDSAGQADEFDGSFQGGSKTLSVARLSGSADLVELAGNLPSLASQIPPNIKIHPFPEIAVKGFSWSGGDTSPTLSIASLQLRKPAEITVIVRNKPLTIDHLTGRASYERKSWHFDGVKGRLLGGSFALDGDYKGRTLSKAEVTLHSLRLATLAPWIKVRSTLDESDLSFTYRGTICNEPTHSTGAGTLELTHAPVVHIPLLDQTYQLFPTLLPRGDHSGTGEFQVAFSMTKGLATIDPFKARGDSLTVTATGTIDLVKRVVAGQARGNLRGIAGIATGPLSHVLTEMQISGPLDNIQVTPLGPGAAAKSLITGTLVTAKGAVIGSAKLSGDILSTSLSLPFEVIGLLGSEDAKARK